MLGREEASETLLSEQLWQNQPAVVLVLRRPGCLLCRAEARSLYALKPELDKLGVRLVCVVHEGLPAEIKAFWPDYWPGELYLDTDKKLYKALGNGKLRKGSLLWFLNPFSVIWQHAREAKEVHKIEDSNLKGDGLTMGGLLILKQGSGGVAYAYAEERFGDHAGNEIILNICREIAAH
ncbi:g2023 [Coccomyxa elongata]